MKSLIFMLAILLHASCSRAPEHDLEKKVIIDRDLLFRTIRMHQSILAGHAEEPSYGRNLTAREALNSAHYLAIFMHVAYGGRPLSDFPVVEVKYIDDERAWSIWFYEGEKISPGGYFSITVDDRTGRAVYH